MLIVRWWSDRRYSYTAVCHHTKHGRERTHDRRTRMRTMVITLDEANEQFKANRSLANARQYRDVALQYWEDDMIGDETLLAILHEIRDE